MKLNTLLTALFVAGAMNQDTFASVFTFEREAISFPGSRAEIQAKLDEYDEASPLEQQQLFYETLNPFTESAQRTDFHNLILDKEMDHFLKLDDHQKRERFIQIITTGSVFSIQTTDPSKGN